MGAAESTFSNCPNYRVPPVNTAISLPMTANHAARARTLVTVASTVALLLVANIGCASESLRVCADPDNLPFSNERLEGFENKIAALIAKDMRVPVDYTWLKQRQNFFRQTLGAQRCDVVMAVPAHFDRVLATRPYYQSSYVIVTKTSRHLQIASYDDPILRDLKIGLHVIGNDGSNAPPAVALGRHGLAKNIVGFSMWGDTASSNPQARIIDAVATGEIDAAIVWGPLGGYFANQYGESLAVSVAPNEPDMPALLFSYDMAFGVRKGDTALASKLEASAARHRSEIQNILAAYHIPVTEFADGLSPTQSTAFLNTSLKN